MNALSFTSVPSAVSVTETQSDQNWTENSAPEFVYSFRFFFLIIIYINAGSHFRLFGGDLPFNGAKSKWQQRDRKGIKKFFFFFK